MFGVRYTRFIQSLPTICPPVAPTVIGFASLAVMYAVSVFWPASLLGIALLALVPQRDSCVFRLMDFIVYVLLIVMGIIDIFKFAAG